MHWWQLLAAGAQSLGSQRVIYDPWLPPDSWFLSSSFQPFLVCGAPFPAVVLHFLFYVIL